MEIIAGTTQFKLNRKTAVAIGKFDGLHIGHRRLLEEILAYQKDGLAACVFTFDPPPSVLFGTGDGKELMTREEKRCFLKQIGVDILIEFPLTHQSAAMEAEVFIAQLLVKQMNARFIAAGSDLSFGAGGRGNAVLLQERAPQYDYLVKIIDKVWLDNIEISSTYVRKLVEKGKMQQAEKFLGMPYTIIGKVVHGNRIGRTVGMPTVNLLPPAGKMMPPCGVYFSSVLYNGKYYRGISNVGYKPTVASEQNLGIETYLYDFDSEIYGEEIQVCLHEFKRPEQKFESLEQLVAQMHEDIEAGRHWDKSVS